MKPLKIGLLAGALALSSAAAMAQGVDLRPENSIPKYERGPTSNDNAPYRGGTYKPDDVRRGYDQGGHDGARYEMISQREAIRIARRNGVAEIDQARWTGNVWVIDGSDRRGDELRVEINARGEIVDVDRS
ncbi:hypothetical protein B6S44_16725 [Bosea sp. Tri-44]|uniref:hypothetical protein n=1 Tax=Bosea sp. Tri-44 TaxID=1972137 RepID=UPI0010100831|nr:hypothetical protein [Bosea sp. Tri-44]RXT52423.1 hypothetical protein B6S44_16725 [Bosea sp. Tri-44]